MALPAYPKRPASRTTYLSSIASVDAKFAVGYVRTSSFSYLGADKDSEERRVWAIMNMAAQMDFTIVDGAVFNDPGVTGKDPVESRGGSSEMIEYCHGNSIRNICVEYAARSARDLMVQDIAYKRLTESGCMPYVASNPQQFLLNLRDPLL